MSEDDRKHLRVVAAVSESHQSPRGQLALPLFDNASLIMLAHVTNVPEQAFLRLLDEAKPDRIIDLRLVPRFDFGRLNRKSVFRLFAEMAASYHDLPHELGVTSRNDALLNPALFAEQLNRIVSRAPQAHRVLVFLDNARMLDNSAKVLPTRLSTPPEGSWRLRCFESADLGRLGETLFLKPKPTS